MLRCLMQQSISWLELALHEYVFLLFFLFIARLVWLPYRICRAIRNICFDFFPALFCRCLSLELQFTSCVSQVINLFSMRKLYCYGKEQWEMVAICQAWPARIQTLFIGHWQVGIALLDRSDMVRNGRYPLTVRICTYFIRLYLPPSWLARRESISCSVWVHSRSPRFALL